MTALRDACGVEGSDAGFGTAWTTSGADHRLESAGAPGGVFKLCWCPGEAARENCEAGARGAFAYTVGPA